MGSGGCVIYVTTGTERIQIVQQLSGGKKRAVTGESALKSQSSTDRGFT